MKPPQDQIVADLEKRQARYLFWVKFWVGVDLVCFIFSGFEVLSGSQTGAWTEMTIVTGMLLIGAYHDLKQIRGDFRRMRKDVL